MFKKYDHKRVVYGDKTFPNNAYETIDKAKIVEFIQRYSLPFVVNFDHDSAQKAFRGWVDSHLLIFASRQNHTWDQINQVGSQLARKPEFYMKVNHSMNRLLVVLQI